MSLLLFAGLFGNAGSAHARGLINKAALEEARDRVAECLGVASSTIFFTSGATGLLTRFPFFAVHVHVSS